MDKYKTIKKYKCPYCDLKATRSDLVDHVDRVHNELIPENYTAAQAVYDFINNKNYGTCMICHKKIYKWNDKINKYYNLCDDKKCRDEVRRIALERHMRVYNKPTLLNDAEHQEKMLANRRISGSYTFTDGGKITYTGSYEKNTLEFMDKILEIPSKDIQAPGPVLEYEYNGVKHKWITDIYYIPGNLLIEVKDGGSNPNKRTMTVYREKQIAKEKMITDLGTFNYIRLTNNDFSQLLLIFADMKNEALKNENPKAVIHINEEVGGLPPHRPSQEYIISYGMNNVFSGFACSNINSDYIIKDSEDKNNDIEIMSKNDFKNKYNTGLPLYNIGEEFGFDDIINKKENPSALKIVESIVSTNKLSDWKKVFLNEKFVYIDIDKEKKINKLLENGINIEREYNGVIDNTSVVDTIDNVFIVQSPNGYYACTSDLFYLVSDYYDTIEELKNSNIISLMNNIYNANVGGDEHGWYL